MDGGEISVGLGWCLTGIEGVVDIRDSVVVSVGVLRTARRSYYLFEASRVFQMGGWKMSVTLWAL